MCILSVGHVHASSWAYAHFQLSIHVYASSWACIHFQVSICILLIEHVHSAEMTVLLIVSEPSTVHVYRDSLPVNLLLQNLNHRHLQTVQNFSCKEMSVSWSVVIFCMLIVCIWHLLQHNNCFVFHQCNHVHKICIAHSQLFACITYIACGTLSVSWARVCFKLSLCMHPVEQVHTSSWACTHFQVNIHVLTSSWACTC